MKIPFFDLRALTLVFLSLPCFLQAQTLVHRYSFATNANDSVGTANGTLVAGNNAATINNGLVLPGTGTSGNPSGYVSLPNGIVSGDTSVTVECWVTQAAQHTWGQIWSFGVAGGNANFGLIPYSGGNPVNMRVAFIPNGAGEVDINVTNGTPLPAGPENYIAVTYNNSNLVGNIYTNGIFDGTTTFPSAAYSPGAYNTTEDVLGLDPYSGDAQFAGTIYELRIWNGAVAQRYVAASALLGPSNVVTSLIPTLVTVTSPNVIASETIQATVTVQIPPTGTTNLVATGDATNWVSGNTNVLTVSSKGVISGLNPGTTTVSATIAGVTGTSAPITVLPPVLAHRYSFVSNANDSVGTANGTLQPQTSGTAATINNGLHLPGSGGGTISGFVSLPAGVIFGDSSITVESWVTQTAARTWAELWDFGNNGNENFALIPFPANNNGNMEVAFNPNNNDIYTATSSPFPSGVEQYVALTYNNVTLTGSLYTNGVLDVSQVYPNANYSPGGASGYGGSTADNYLGADVYGDSQFDGTLYEFRIWNGAVSPLYLAASAVAGSTVVVTNLTPLSNSVTVTNYSMVGAATQQAAVTGYFPQVSGVTVTSFASNWISSNPQILTVSSSGLITAQNGGTATVSATVNGVTATSATITVQLTSPDITQEPSSDVVFAGESATLTVSALGGDLSYQWLFNGVAISGATSSVLTLTNLGTNQAGNYTVEVFNPVGTNFSSPPAVLTVNEPILEHRYSFIADASDSVGGTNWNGTLVPPGNANGGAATIANGLSLPGNTAGGFGYSGYVSLPTGIIEGDDSITVECWVTQNQGNTWAEIWDFSSPNFNQNFGLIPNPNNNNGNIEVPFTPNGGEVDLQSHDAFPNGSEQYVVLTLDYVSLMANLYTNGSLIASLTLPNAAYSPGTYSLPGGTPQNLLGNDRYGDEQFSGTIYEFRIWDGAVSPLYIAVSSAAGPSVVVTNLTPLSGSVDISVTNMQLNAGAVEQAAVLAEFEQVTNNSGANIPVTVTSSVTNWSSSATNVVTVNASGLITAVGNGSATISASVGGVTGTLVITSQGGPVITAQPAASEEILIGGTLHASVSNIGLAPVSYSWYYNGGTQPISGATNATLTLPDVQSAEAGSYAVIVSNAYGTATSSPTVLTVLVPTPYQSNLLSLNPLAYWPLNEASGPVAYDLAGGYNGTYFGNVFFQQMGATNAEFGSPSYAAGFDGSSAYVDIPGGPFNITGAITVMAWVSSTFLPTFADIVGHGDASWRTSILGTPNGGANGEPGGNDGDAQGDATSPTSILDGNWHFVVYSYTGNINNADNGSLYVDGALVANNSVFTTPPGNSLDVFIGGAPDYNNRFLDGDIANVAILDYAASATDVQFLYTAQGSPSPVTLTIAPSGANVVLTWPAGTLLQAPSLLGPWTTNNATSPYTTPATNATEFYKILVYP